MAIKEDFQQWLVDQGYNNVKIGGRYEASDLYPNGVEFICFNENISFEDLVKNIDTIIAKYDIGGEQERMGQLVNESFRFIDVLKLFKKFLESRK